MTGFIQIFAIIAQSRPCLIAIDCGPSEIRTRDLLNAIETRSQLRYGPRLTYGSQPLILLGASAIDDPGGPEGIRTPDLLSAIEARSQLRYRPAAHPGGLFLGDGYST